MEFSKKITVLSWTVAITLTVLSVVFPIWNIPVDGVVAALPYSWGEVTACTGFYLWKAKNENRHKYAMRYLKTITEQYGMDAALRVAEIVLKD